MEPVAAPAQEDATEFRFGIDIEVHTDDEEVSSQHYRVKRIENLEKCTRLKKLSIVASCVDELINLDNNTELQELEVYQGLVKEIRNISHLTNLRVLDLSFNEIKRIEGIDTLCNLEKLFLSNNKIAVVEGLDSLKKLRVLELGSNRIRSVNSPCFDHLGNLEELWLGKNKLTDMNDLNNFHFPSLKQLSLQSNRLTQWAPKLFSQVAPNLTNIYLGSNQLPDMDTDTLAAVNADVMEELDISCNALTTVPQFPKPMAVLTELWLNDNKITSTEGLRTLRDVYPALKTIYIERNPVHAQCPLDCRNEILRNAPDSLEQIDAVMIPRHELRVSASVDYHVKKTILKH